MSLVDLLSSLLLLQIKHNIQKSSLALRCNAEMIYKNQDLTEINEAFKLSKVLLDVKNNKL